MPNAFISYRRKPSSSLAHLLQKDLQSQYGFDIYLDTTRSDSAKVQFPERLLSAIDTSDVFICLLADTTLESEWVLREIQRAFDGQKPCIPVFQESYQPTAIDHPAVDYLLSFDGVHVLDERGLHMDYSVQEIGTIIRNTLPKRRRTALYLLPLVLLVVGLIAAIMLLNNGNDDNRERATASHEAAVEETSDTPDPTSTQTPTSTNTSPGDQATNTLSVDERAQATATAVSTLNEDYRRTTATEQTIRDGYATATALPLTQAAQETVEAIAVGTHVVELQATQTTWTPTPSSTPSNTATPTPTATQSPIELAKTRVAHNSDWTIYSELDSTGVEMVLVPAGCFMMGSWNGEPDEGPVREQCIDEPFWIDRYEVTNEQYGSVGCSTYSSKPDQPRNCISWYDARNYCESRGARLPTEREWEYAARGPDSLIYPWGDTYDAAFVIGSDDPFYGQNKPAAVGSRPQGISWVGALDMSGNVLEWTSSVYMDYPYVETDGREDLTGTDFRVLRAGSFASTAYYIRAANRFRIGPRYEDQLVGFRCTRSLP